MKDENRLRRLEGRFAGEKRWQDVFYGATLCTYCPVSQLQKAEEATKRFPYPEFEWAYDLQPKRDRLAELLDRTLPKARAGCEVLNIVEGCPYGEESGMALIEAGWEFWKEWKERYRPEIVASRKSRKDRRVCVVCESPECVYEDEHDFRYCKEHAPLRVEYWNLKPVEGESERSSRSGS